MNSTIMVPRHFWAIIPFIDCPDMTIRAAQDCLAQTIPTRVLLVDQGSSRESREAVDRWIEARGVKGQLGYPLADGSPLDGPVPRVLCWHYLPALPSLSGVWNRALDFCWAGGATEALVVNNDVRLHPDLLAALQTTAAVEEAFFVSAVGRREPEYKALAGTNMATVWKPTDRGGPDFSCFLISKGCHAAYRFDEGFVPAYHEDLDYHRRLMLAGDGARIFSINFPYLHYASQTLNQATPEAQEKFRAAFGRCREYYMQKWGGPPNEETFRAPFGRGEYSRWLTAALLLDPELTTTPELQRYVQRRGLEQPS